MEEITLKTLYRQLLLKLSEKLPGAVTVKFCFQCGKLFPKAKNAGLLFVGRCTNGWHSYSNDVDELFDQNSPQCVFKKDAIRCMFEGKDPYNPNLSSFWRVTKRIAEYFYGDSWFDYVAWTNLFKIAPEEGNCGAKLGGLQYKYVVDILRVEVEILSTKVIIFFTGDEAKDWITTDFIKAVTESSIMPSFNKTAWGKYSFSWAIIEERLIIITEHPQGKPEETHWQALLQCICKLPLWKMV